jgi:hypothetical protein
MGSENRSAELYAAHVRLELGGRRYLTERQERELLLTAVDMRLPLEEAREILQTITAERSATLESRLDETLRTTISAFAGKRRRLTRESFDRAVAVCRELSSGAISFLDARIRVKRLLLAEGVTVRGAIIFGTPRWFRDIPERGVQ